MKQLLLAILILGPFTAKTQTYADTLLKHREAYKKEFLTDAHSPLKKKDLSYLRFYTPAANYRVPAKFELSADTAVFNMGTYSGKTKRYRKYGTLSFSLDGRNQTLAIYQSPDLILRPELKDYLFVPFRDLTNNEETYGGGRYLDLRIGDLSSGVFMMDFNKAYNPYCAYSDGYNCPIPPDENHLQVAIKAGEKTFGKSH